MTKVIKTYTAVWGHHWFILSWVEPRHKFLSLWNLNQEILGVPAEVSWAPTWDFLPLYSNCCLCVPAFFLTSLTESQTAWPQGRAYNPCWVDRGALSPSPHPPHFSVRAGGTQIKQRSSKPLSRILYWSYREEAHSCLLGHDARRTWIWGCRKSCSPLAEGMVNKQSGQPWPSYHLQAPRAAYFWLFFQSCELLQYLSNKSNSRSKWFWLSLTTNGILKNTLVFCSKTTGHEMFFPYVSTVISGLTVTEV